jgi:S1-C subfamily serine protease
MPLRDSYANAVWFVCANRKAANGTVGPRPIGTCFIVSVPAEAKDRAFVYIVTAWHVVEGEAETWVRMRGLDGTTADVTVGDWVPHPTADVAIAQVSVPLHQYEVVWAHVPEATFADKGERQPLLGERVYFIGLLAQIESMASTAVPIVRSGTVGRLNQIGIPVKQKDETTKYVDGHLIDCRSHQGFSGSPCFIQRDAVRMANLAPDGSVQPDSYFDVGDDTRLIGMVVGHFDDMVDAKLAEDDSIDSGIRSPINTGIGVILPCERIREVLDLEEFVERRKATNKKATEAEPEESGATLDAVKDDRYKRSDFVHDLNKVTKKQPEKEA